MSKLPKEKTSVLTILRDPVDRVFSAYEFSVEVGARFLLHPNITSAIRMTNRLRAKGKAISTLDIWPWKYLVPWMRKDLFARVLLSSYYCFFIFRNFYAWMSIVLSNFFWCLNLLGYYVQVVVDFLCNLTSTMVLWFSYFLTP